MTVNAPQKLINRMQPTKRKASATIISIIDGLIFIISLIERTLSKQH